MDRLFFYALFILAMLFILFLPIIISIDTHFDLSIKKVGFAVFLYKRLKIFGGYAHSAKGGVALHLSKKKAVWVPYRQMDSERKKFSFLKSFQPLSLSYTAETGANYLLPVGVGECIVRCLFFLNGGKAEKIKNNLWLTDNDVLRLSLRYTFYFNAFILLSNFIKFLKEKIKILWQKNTKKSII